jgi:hypothetical protein
MANLAERIMAAMMRVLEWLRAILSSHGQRGPSLLERVTYYATRAVIIGAAGYLLYLLARWIVRRSMEGGVEGGYSAAATVEEPLQASVDRPSALRARAQQARESGDLRLAIRLYFLAYLVLLSDLGLIQFSVKATNGDYLREMPPSTGRHGEFRDAAGVFERIWYGGHAALNDDVVRLEALSRGGGGGAG